MAPPEQDVEEISWEATGGDPPAVLQTLRRVGDTYTIAVEEELVDEELDVLKTNINETRTDLRKVLRRLGHLASRGQVVHDTVEDHRQTLHCLASDTMKNEELKKEVKRLGEAMNDLREQRDMLQEHVADLKDSERKLLQEKKELQIYFESAVNRVKELENEASMLREATRRNEEIRQDTEARTRAQLNDMSQRLEATRGRYDSMAEGIKPVLDIIEYAPVDPPVGVFGDRALGPFEIIHRSRQALRHFKTFCSDMVETVAAHVLGVVRSYYPGVKNDRVKDGYAHGTTNEEEDQLEKEVKLAAEALAADMVLFPTQGT